MKAVTLLLDGSPHRYERLAAALSRSAAKNSPATPVEVYRSSGADREIFDAGQGLSRTFIDNTRKTKHLSEIVSSAANGELLCLIDSDTMILGDLSPAADLVKDFGYTVRPVHCRYPINTGVLFVRVSKKTRDFFAEWYRTNLRIVGDRRTFKTLAAKYAGINQCALGDMLERGCDAPLKTTRLPCEVWNSTVELWQTFGPETKVVHLLGSLRGYCLGTVPINAHPIARRLAMIWKEYDSP